MSSTATAAATATATPASPGANGIEGIVVVVIVVEEVVVFASLECVEEVVVLLFSRGVKIEVVEGVAVCDLVARSSWNNKVMNGVVGRTSLNSLNGFVHGHAEFDPSGEVKVLREGTDELK